MFVVLRLCQEVSVPSAFSLHVISKDAPVRCVADSSRSNPLSNQYTILCLNSLKIYFG